MRDAQKVLGGRRITVPKLYGDFLDIKEGDLVVVELDKSKKILMIIPAKVIPR